MKESKERGIRMSDLKQKEQAFHKALNDLDDDKGYAIGSYTGALKACVRALDEVRSILSTNYEELYELYQQMRKEKKRYKQALEKVLTTDDFEDILDYIDRVTTIAGEALAGDKHEQRN